MWVITRIIAVLLILTDYLCTQNISKLEYFIDIDPGYGNGQDVPISASSSIDQSFLVDLTGVGEGFHKLIIRSRNEDGIWSISNVRPFFIQKTVPVSPPNIISILYAFSNDIMLTNWNSYSRFSPSSNISVEFVGDISNLDYGTSYQAYSFVLNEDGHPSFLSRTAFITDSTAVARNDTVQTLEDSPIRVFVLSNDTDIGNESVRIDSIVQQCVNGFASIDIGDTTITYLPNADFYGQDSFLYSIRDSYGFLDTAKVLIDVVPVNDSPTFFAIVKPEDSTYIQLTEENQNDTLKFVWNPSLDVDGDTISYRLGFAEDLAILSSITTRDTMHNWLYSELTWIIKEAGSDLVQGNWNVLATDGIDTVTASNGHFVLSIDASLLGISEGEYVPSEYAIYQNHPNPFNPTTNIRYDLPEKVHVTVVIYDLLGRKVTVLVEETQSAGRKSVTWKGNDKTGNPVSAGVYLCHIRAGEFRQTHKMILIK